MVAHFQTGDRKRGSEYAQDGRVQLDVNGTRASARVRGNERRSYAVGLDWSRVASDRTLHAFCGCERFARGRPCKHVWATLLTLDDAKPEKPAPGGDRLKLHKDPAHNWRELGSPAEGEATPRRRQESYNRRGQRARSVRRRSGPIAPWRSQLDAVCDQIERLADQGDAPPRIQQQELFFLVDTNASSDGEAVYLDIFCRSTRANARLERTNVAPDALAEWLRPADAPPDSSSEVVTALPAERANHNRRGGRGRRPQPVTARRLRLPRGRWRAILYELADRGALGYWDGRSVGGHRPLTWDPGAPWQVLLAVEFDESGTARLAGRLERGEQRVRLNEVTLVLPPDHHGADLDDHDHDHDEDWADDLDLAEDEAADPADDDDADDDDPADDLEEEDLEGDDDLDASDEETALVFVGGRIGRLAIRGEHDLAWVTAWKSSGELLVPREDAEEALASLFELPDPPRFDITGAKQIEAGATGFEARLVLEPDPNSPFPEPPLLADLSFRYGEHEVPAGDGRRAIVDWPERLIVRRDMNREHRSLIRLLELGLEPAPAGQGHGLELDPRQLAMVAEPLLAEGWSVDVRGRSLRPPKAPTLRVESGIDWFELSGEVDFAGDPVELKAILDAISRGEHFVRLEDGSEGLLPASWVETYGSLAELAQDESETGLRFLPSQALFVDALLAAMPPANVDAEFAELRKKLVAFDRIKPKKEPRGFGGELRGYQREGLGWLEFLREYSLGGILADDMGLGKTVQVLALIKANRTKARTSGRPFLVVAPRSLIYNWGDEAARFTRTLKVVQYLGPDRESLHGKLDKYDIVVTTYGTLRLDIAYLATVEFDTVILDEAQAIKNPGSQTAKASRLLVARHRLALTGTPIENHLGELGSIFDFLNPGLLGRLPKLDVLANGGAPSKQQLELVAKGVKPFILRRTKAQVLKDLPPKTEQVLSCTLSSAQREIYDQVRAGYQVSLLEKVESEGMGKSSIQVLEALLRLRQIACHPGLVDEKWMDAGSAKLDTLFDQVKEVLDEGHKVIVFSQFTKLLGFVRDHLDERGVNYAYLDGQTRKRGEVVERFQTDPDVNLFLISLKAGGVGLNLTAAGYVFLLDPWWNPAVEAQAIDRAHRIGQTQPVFAYRMIAQDTVEEKIIELQRSKRQIADAILEGGGKPLGEMTADDLRMLLS